MRPPVMEVRVFRVSQATGWEFVVLERGELLAASDGDEHHERIVDAFRAALIAIQAAIRGRRGIQGEGGGEP